MLAALLDGEGLRGIAELAAAEAGAPVAIVLPGRGLADAWSREVELVELSRYAAERLGGGTPEAALSEDRERLGLGAKADRLLARRCRGGRSAVTRGRPALRASLAGREDGQPTSHGRLKRVGSARRT